MPLPVSLTLQDVYTKLGDLITEVVAAGVVVIQGLPNRTAMPAPSPGFVSMTVNLMRALRTPQESWDRDDPAPTTIAIEQGTQLRVQLDCYGAGSTEWAVALVALLRSDYSIAFLAPVSPLYADDPMQAALVDGEEQYEQRWIVGANLQYNPVVTVPMQFADTATVGLINVDVSYPP